LDQGIDQYLRIRRPCRRLHTWSWPHEIELAIAVGEKDVVAPEPGQETWPVQPEKMISAGTMGSIDTFVQ
jgi:hypothetical protein